MGFVKKTWANGVSPAINATNLNLNEDAIYNNSVISGNVFGTSVISQAISVVDTNYDQVSDDIISIEIADAISGGAVTINVNSGGALNLKDSNGNDIENLQPGIYLIAFSTTYYELVSGGESGIALFETQEDSEYPITVPTLNKIAPTIKGIFNGNLLYQAITNGDFASTSDWTDVYGVLATSGNIGTLTGDGSGGSPRIQQDTPISYSDGDKIYVKVRARVTNSLATELKVSIDGSTAGTALDITQSSPTINAWYVFNGIFTIPADFTGFLRILIRNIYTNTTDANGAVMEIDGNAGVFAINLTQAFGAGNEPTADEVKSWIGDYFEGFKTAEQQEIYSVGKNLFDKGRDVAFAGYNISSGGGTNPSSSQFISRFYDVSGVSSITLSCDTANTMSIGEYSREDEDTFILRTQVTSTESSVTLNGSTGYVRFSANKSEYDTLQLEIGTSVTDYEEHKSSTIVLPEIGANLPNEVCDKIYQDGNNEWMHEKNISDLTAISSGTTISTSTYSDASATGVYIIALDGGGTQSGDIADGDTASGNGDIYYQLATPVTTELEEIDQLLTYEDGSIFVTPDTIAGKSISIDYSTNNSAQNEATAKASIIPVTGGLKLTDKHITDETGSYNIDGTTSRIGESFTCEETIKIKRAEFKVQRTTGRGRFIARLYDVTGTVGTDAKPSTDVILASSEIIYIEDLPYSPRQDLQFYFEKENRFELQKDTDYAIVVERLDGSGSGTILYSTTILKSNGNAIYYSTSWNAQSSRDVMFKIYGEVS